MPIDEPHTVSDERWLARQVVRMHVDPADPTRATKRCPHCGPDGECRQLTWASIIVSIEPASDDHEPR